MSELRVDWAKAVSYVLSLEGLKQSGLARLCGVTQQNVSLVKTGARQPGVSFRKELRTLLSKHDKSPEDFQVEVDNFMDDPEMKLILKLLRKSDKVKRAQALATVKALLT